MSRTPVSVVGSGLAGTLLATYLAQAGKFVDLYERRPDPRLIPQPAGRSINLALSARGLYALEQVGLKDQVLTQAIPMRGRMMHDLSGRLTFQAYGLHGHEYINSISRAYLNEVLMDAAEAAGAMIRFEQRATGMDFEKRQSFFVDDSSGRSYSLSQTPVIATDGAGSALRRSLIQRLRVNYAQDYLPHAYKELTIPAGANGDFQLQPDALHIWPRQSFMLIALPNPDKTFTCTLFLAFEGDQQNPGQNPGFDQLQTPEAVRSFFESYFGDVLPLIPELENHFFANPTGALSTIHTAPWYVEDQLLLLGDAAHAIVPFFGQGMNAAFEDCSLLMQQLPGFESDWAGLFRQFYASRKADADAIAAMALENFIEMRDKVADAEFLLHKKVSLKLEERYPELFIPKYSLVSFHRVPYSVALRHGELQQQLLSTLCQGLSSPEQINWQLAEELIKDFREQAPALGPGI